MEKVKITKIVLVAIILAGSFGFVCGVLVTRESNAKRVSFEQELQDRIEEAKAKIKEAKIKTANAEFKIKEAEKLAEGYRLREKKQLFKLYPNLEEYKAGNNVVNKRYITSFVVHGSNIKIEMDNKSHDKIRPNAKIIFFNNHGFVTDTYTLFWFVSSIAPGETRFDEGRVEFRFGPPTYYTIDFYN